MKHAQEKNPSSSAPMPDELRRRNRAFGLILAGVAASMFALALVVALWVHFAENHHVFSAH